MNARRSDIVWAAGIALAALVVRALYLHELRATPFFAHLLLNAADYDAWARNGYPAGEPYYQAPLYIGFLKIVYAVAGDANRLAAARWVQAALAGGTAVLAFALARSAWGRVAGVAAGLACALSAPLAFHDGELLPTALETFLLVATIAAAATVVAAPRGGREGLARAFGAGLLLGVAATCRPTFLVLAPVVLALVWFAARGSGAGHAARLVIAAYAVGIALPVGGVAVRNLSAGQGFVLLTSNLGPNLLLGHNPDADGIDPFLPDRITRARREWVQRGATQVQLSRAATAEALRYAQAEPGRTLALWIKKLILFYNRYEIPNDRSIRDAVSRSPMLRAPPFAWVGVGLLFPLALAGLVAAGRRPELRRLVGLAVLAGALAYAPFIVCARFRAPFVPLLAILAGGAIAALARRPPRRQTLAMAALAVAGIILVWPDWYGVRARSEFVPLARNQARLCTDLAQEALRAGDRARAAALLDDGRRALAASVQANPQSPAAFEALGGFLVLQDDRDGAAAAYERALDLDPQTAEANRGLAMLATLEGEYTMAEAFMQQAMTADPGREDDVAKLADIVFARGRWAESIPLYERAAASGAADAAYLRAQIALAGARIAEAGEQFETAEAEFRAAAAGHAANPTYAVELALYLHRRGRTEEALVLLRECAANPAFPPLRRRQIEDLIGRVERGR